MTPARTPLVSIVAANRVDGRHARKNTKCSDRAIGTRVGMKIQIPATATVKTIRNTRRRRSAASSRGLSPRPLPQRGAMDAQHLGGRGAVLRRLLQGRRRKAAARPPRENARRDRGEAWPRKDAPAAHARTARCNVGRWILRLRGGQFAGRRKVFRPDRSAAGQQRRVFHGVAQFAHVSRPGSRAQLFDAAGREAGGRGAGRRAKRRKCSANSGMSSIRCRSGGRAISKPARRKNRSSRKRLLPPAVAQVAIGGGDHPEPASFAAWCRRRGSLRAVPARAAT